MGNKTVATVQKVESYIETNPEFIPSYMNKDEFAKDIKVVTQLTPLQNVAYQLASDLRYKNASGSEAVAEALIYYGSLERSCQKRDSAVETYLYEELSERFTQRNKPKTRIDVLFKSETLQVICIFFINHFKISQSLKK